MKVGIVYTATTPESVEAINGEIRKRLCDETEIMNYQDPTILTEVCENGHVTASAAARLVSMFMQAVSDGADAIMSCCSSVGEVVDASQNLARYIGIPIKKLMKICAKKRFSKGKELGYWQPFPQHWNRPKTQYFAWHVS